MNNDWLDYLSVNNYLEHHGILGQKWGDRNGPPYPLDAEDHSAKEKKAGYKKSIDSKKYTRKEARNLYRIQNIYEATKLEDLTTGKGKYAKQLSKLEKESGERTNAYSYDSKGNLIGKVQTSTENADKALEEYRKLYGKAEDEAYKWAQEKMKEDYGDYSLSFIQKYNNQNAAITAATFLGTFGGFVAYELLR